MGRPNIEHCHGAYLIHRGRGESELIQTDWDYPATAQRYGWNLRRVQPGVRTLEDPEPAARVLQRAPNRGHGCDHAGSDGTVNCGCGVGAGEFISAAAEYLDSLC